MTIGLACWKRATARNGWQGSAVCQRLSVPPNMAPSLRHTYICLRLMEGADIYQIAKNCRTSVEMIEKYTPPTSRRGSTPRRSTWEAQTARKKRINRQEDEAISDLCPGNS